MATVCFLYPLLLALGLDFGFLFAHIYIHVVVVVVVANDTIACYVDALLVAAFAIVVANDISIV